MAYNGEGGMAEDFTTLGAAGYYLLLRAVYDSMPIIPE